MNFLGDVTLDQALAVFGEHRLIPNLIIQRQPDKPAEQQIVLQLLHQAAAPSAPNRTPATAKREASARAGSATNQTWRTGLRIPATVPPMLRPQPAGSRATGDPLEPA